MRSLIHQSISVFCLVLAATLAGKASVSYDDVAVIVNMNSPTSVAIGNYFKNARSIPAVNMIYVAVDTSEEIDSTTFDILRGQVESHLTTNNLVNAINYIVTTKGVPLKIYKGDTFSTMSPSASVESELMLILGAYSPYIGGLGRVTSPYYYQTAEFTRSAYGVYLVTRLDGYTLQHVFTLIDKSGPEISVAPGSTYVFDQDPDWNASIPSLNTNLATARTTLETKGKTVVLDQSATYMTNTPSVIGYTSWGSNDHYATNYTTNAIPHNTWANGAIAETYVSTSGRSFMSPPAYGQSLIADLVQEGISGVKGYVYEPFSSSMAIAYILFDRYTSGYNLAESFYMSSRYCSWMDVIIGDPKTSIDGPPSPPLPIQLRHFEVRQQTSAVHVTWGTLSETNNYGFFVQHRDSTQETFADIPGSFVAGHGTTLVPREYSWIHQGVAPGTHRYRLRQVDLDGTVHFTESVTIVISPTTSVTELTAPDKFELSQNYPNPFNPTTVIAYTTQRPGHVLLKVYNQLGEEISTLIDEVQPAGAHSVLFSTSGVNMHLASGAYFYRIETDNQSITKRMTLLR